jgi:putative transposase
MDGKGRWMDNVFIERLWRSVKYERVYLYSYDSIADLRAALKTYFSFFNQVRWVSFQCKTRVRFRCKSTV